jgi:DNA-binding XRE family transcriptional regulator
MTPSSHRAVSKILTYNECQYVCMPYNQVDAVTRHSRLMAPTNRLCGGHTFRAVRMCSRINMDTAPVAGILKQFLPQVERGHVTPSLKSLTGIASALGVTLRYFVDTPNEGRSIVRRHQSMSLQFL